MPVPGDRHASVCPHLHYDDPVAAVTWLVRVFGFAERMSFDRGGGSLMARLEGPDGGVVMVSGLGDESREWMRERAPRFEEAAGSCWPLLTHATTVFVDHVDAHHARAEREGAIILSGPKDQPWGLRSYAALDPEGHQWEFAMFTAQPASEAEEAAHSVATAHDTRRNASMRRNRSVPPPTVVPVLVYPDVRAAVSWLTAAFGFIERTRVGESHRAQMSIGADGAMIVADTRGEQAPPHDGVVSHVTRVRVEDVHAQFERARAHGARVLEPPTDREYGEVDCTVEDLAGHRWQFAETTGDVAPEEFGCETVSPWPDPPDA